MAFDDLESEALKLTAVNRGKLLLWLLSSLDEHRSHPDHERLCNDGIERRSRAIDDGKARLIPAKEVYARAEAALDTPALAFEELLSLALKLPPADREVLVRALILRLDGSVEALPEEEIRKLWVAEARRRYQDYVESRETAIPGEEALRSLRALLKGNRQRRGSR